MTDSRSLQTSMETLDAISDAECRRLLGTQTLGRVGITSGGLPHILPVRYLYDDGAIEFRTGAGSKLRAAVSGDVLAFEVDSFEPESGRGWSVLVLGRASVIGLRGASERDYDVRLRCEMVTGRSITFEGHPTRV